MNYDELMDAFLNKCRQSKLKITPQRLMLYRELLKSGNHPSADNIHKKAKKKFPSISFDTVNRTLMTFSKMGLVKIVEGYGNPRRFDANPLNHHHFRCLECMDIIDIYNRSFDELDIPDDIAKQHQIMSKKVILEGFCRECQKSKVGRKVTVVIKK